MLQEYNIVIADTSCFILLEKIGEFDLLQKIFGTIITTDTIAAEFGKSLPEWVQIEVVTNKIYQRMLEIEVDNGEASAIALAVARGNSLLILDDNKARKLSAKLNLLYTGTLGVILKAKQLGVLTTVKPILSKIQQTNFRLSEKNYLDILHLAGE